MNYTKLVSNETKFHKISGDLSGLKINTLYSVMDIVKLIFQIDNFKSKTLSNIKPAQQYSGPTNLVKIADLYVDMTYQRALFLTYIINMIKKNGFDKEAAGNIDVAERPNDVKTVWDGIRRAIMAALCGYTHIPCYLTIHPSHFDDKDCQKKEARLFRIKNDKPKMKPEEIFKSEVAYSDPVALKILKLLKDSGLDIIGLNPTGKPLGGILEIKNNFENWKDNIKDKDIDEDGPYDWDRDLWIESSEIIQEVWNRPEDATVSVYLLRDLAWLKTVMKECDEQYSDDEIKEKLNKWRKKYQKLNQKDITSLGFKKKPLTSYYIAKHILQDNNGLTKKLYSHLNDDHKKLYEPKIVYKTI